MSRRRSFVILCILCAFFLLATFGVRAYAQGRFANFETPQTHPIDIAEVEGKEYVLVCNTPDNSIEIYEAAPPHAFVQRVAVEDQIIVHLRIPFFDPPATPEQATAPVEDSRRPLRPDLRLGERCRLTRRIRRYESQRMVPYGTSSAF